MMGNGTLPHSNKSLSYHQLEILRKYCEKDDRKQVLSNRSSMPAGSEAEDLESGWFNQQQLRKQPLKSMDFANILRSSSNIVLGGEKVDLNRTKQIVTTINVVIFFIFLVTPIIERGYYE